MRIRFTISWVSKGPGPVRDSRTFKVSGDLSPFFSITSMRHVTPFESRGTHMGPSSPTTTGYASTGKPLSSISSLIFDQSLTEPCPPLPPSGAVGVFFNKGYNGCHTGYGGGAPCCTVEEGTVISPSSCCFSDPVGAVGRYLVIHLVQQGDAVSCIPTSFVPLPTTSPPPPTKQGGCPLPPPPPPQSSRLGGR